MKKKISFVIGIFGIALLGFGLYLGFNNTEHDYDKSIEISIEIVDKKYIKNCLNDECDENDDLYAHLSTNSDNRIIIDSLDRVNGNTDYYYNYVTMSNFEICEEKKTTHAYRRGISSEYYYYTNDKYVTFSVNRIEKDFCDSTEIILPIETYIYSIKDDKILPQQDFQSELGYTSQELDQLITTYLENNNKDNIRDTYYGKALYYDSLGKLYVSFSWNEYDFMSILLK